MADTGQASVVSAVIGRCRAFSAHTALFFVVLISTATVLFADFGRCRAFSAHTALFFVVLISTAVLVPFIGTRGSIVLLDAMADTGKASVVSAVIGGCMAFSATTALFSVIRISTAVLVPFIRTRGSIVLIDNRTRGIVVLFDNGTTSFSEYVCVTFAFIYLC